MKIDLVPMTAEHYAEAARVAKTALWDDPAMTARQHALSGPCFAGYHGTTLLGVAGVALLHRGVGEAWAILTPAGQRTPLIHRVVVRMLTEIIAMHGLHRVQAKAVRKFYRARAWLIRLGFRKEATLRRMGPDREDFVQYVRLP